jgi:multisubunit Na+/H+ antiporter MnhC subunit
MKNFIAVICSALACVGSFVIFERTIAHMLDGIGFPLIASVLYIASLGAAPGFVAGKVGDQQYAPWIGGLGTAAGMILVLSFLGQRPAMPFSVTREWALLVSLAVPAVSGALIAMAARKS